MTKRRSAFTLLELLTVIGIIGLLVGILMPTLSAARRHAKANVCLSHLKGIGNGFAVYLTENDDRFPPFRLYKTTPDMEEYYVNGYGRRAPRWQWFLETELGPVINPTPHQWAVVTKGHFGDYTPRRRGGPKGSTMSHGVFTCPSLKDEQFAMDIRDGAFGYNYQYLGNTRRDTTETRWDNFSVGLHKIRKTGMTVLVADSRGAGFYHGRHSYTLDPPRLATERRATRFGPSQTKYVEPSLDDWPDEEADDCEANAEGGLGDLPQGLGSDPADVYAYSPVEARHNKRGNVLFADTHAAAMTLTEMGYHLSDGTTPTDVRRGVPIPSRDPTAEGSTATNKLWNGMGVDPMAAQPQDQPPGP